MHADRNVENNPPRAVGADEAYEFLRELEGASESDMEVWRLWKKTVADAVGDGSARGA